MTSLPAKISRPVLPYAMPRTRLFHLVDKSSSRQVVWLSAPAGAGKTTLLASYFDTRKVPVLWYHLDERDNDIATFFYYLDLATANGCFRSKVPLPAYSPASFPSLTQFSSRFFELFFGMLKYPAAVVFDNFAGIPAESPLNEVLLAALNVIPRHVTVYITSRGAPPGILSRLNGADRLSLIGWPQIKLTLDETDGMVSLGSSNTLSFEQLKTIHRRAQGWAAGVVLLSRNAAITQDIRVSADGDLDRDVFTYFSNEILNTLPEDLQDFLFRTSFLPKMTTSSADKLARRDTAGQMLPYLARNNIFTQLFMGDQPVFVYHALFRDFLQVKARERLSGDEISSILLDSAEVLISSGDIDEAVTLLRNAKNWKQLAGLLTLHASKLIDLGRCQTLVSWAREIPDEYLDKTPRLICLIAECQISHDLSRGRSLFERAFALSVESGDWSGIASAWPGIIDSYVQEWNDFSPLDDWFFRIEALLSQPHPPLPADDECRLATAIASALISRQPGHPGLAEWIEKALYLSEIMGCHDLRQQACLLAASYYLWMGDLVRGSIAIEEIRILSEWKSASPLTVLSGVCLQAGLENVVAPQECKGLATVEDGLCYSSERNFPMLDQMLFAQGASGALSISDLDTGLMYLARMKSSLQPTQRHAYSQYHYLCSWAEFLRDDYKRALVHAEMAVRIAEETGFPLLEILCRLAAAQGAQETGDLNKADFHLKIAKKLAIPVGSDMLQFMCLLTEAYKNLKTGDYSAALPLLQEGFAIGKLHGYTNMLWWWRPDVMSSLCCKALEEGIEMEYSRNLIRKRSLIPDAPPVHIENWPWPVQIYTLGRFGIIRDGTPIRFSGKVQQKPLALLKALISLGGRNVAVETMLDLLWPDAEGDDAYKSFTITLHRLRRLLDHDKVILLVDGKVSLDARYCWLDAWAFERLQGALQIAAKGDHVTQLPLQAVGIMEKAVKLYNGHFLDGDTGQLWAVSMRERLRLKALRVIGACGAYHEHRMEWHTAADYYMKGLDVDDNVEEFYQRLMFCHHKTGRPGEALAAFERCRKVLASIGVKPSCKTREMHAAVLNGTLQ